MKPNQIIYVRMLDAVTTYVPCEALRLGPDIYEITKNEDIDLENDATEMWEFFPGDQVRTRMHTTEQSKVTILLASQLISSTFPKRKLYQLLFLIVSNRGVLSVDQLQGFEKEVKQLCSDSTILQSRHPVIAKWLADNCKGA